MGGPTKNSLADKIAISSGHFLTIKASSRPRPPNVLLPSLIIGLIFSGSVRGSSSSQDTSRFSENINQTKSKEHCLAKEIDTVEYSESPFT